MNTIANSAHSLCPWNHAKWAPCTVHHRVSRKYDQMRLYSSHKLTQRIIDKIKCTHRTLSSRYRWWWWCHLLCALLSVPFKRTHTHSNAHINIQNILCNLHVENRNQPKYWSKFNWLIHYNRVSFYSNPQFVIWAKKSSQTQWILYLAISSVEFRFEFVKHKIK